MKLALPLEKEIDAAGLWLKLHVLSSKIGKDTQ